MTKRRLMGWILLRIIVPETQVANRTTVDPPHKAIWSFIRKLNYFNKFETCNGAGVPFTPYLTKKQKILIEQHTKPVLRMHHPPILNEDFSRFRLLRLIIIPPRRRESNTIGEGPPSTLLSDISKRISFQIMEDSDCSELSMFWPVKRCRIFQWYMGRLWFFPRFLEYKHF